MEETNIGNLHRDWKMSTADRLAFWKTLCGLHSENMVDDSQRLKAAIKYPRYLYRYRSVNNNSLAALMDNKLFFLRQITMTILLIHFYESTKIKLSCT